MKKQKLGMHIGNAYYKPRPVTYVLICVIVLALLAGAFFLLKDSIFGGNDDATVNGGVQIPAANTTEPTATPANVLVPVTPTPMVEATIEPTPTPVPTPTPEPTPRSATIRFLGEISIDNNLLSAAMQDDGAYSFAEMFSMVAGAAGKADYTVANVEGSMGGVGDGYSGKGSYNTPESLIGDLKNIGVDMLTLSNDHTLDGGFDGLLDTITNCQENDMNYVGAASTKEEHDTPKIVEINGINVCFLNYTTTVNNKNVASEALEYGVNLAKNSNSRTDAAAAREAGADIVVAVISWGEEGVNSIDSTQKTIAQILLDSGVDVIVGYGPRCVQAVLWLDQPAAEAAEGEEPAEAGKTLCGISLGTMLSSSEKRGLDCGTIFEFTISEQEDGSFVIENPTSIPTYVWQYANEDSTMEYRVVACGEWLEEHPEGMSDEDYARLKEIWEQVPSVVAEASTVEAN